MGLGWCVQVEVRENIGVAWGTGRMEEKDGIGLSGHPGKQRKYFQVPTLHNIEE